MEILLVLGFLALVLIPILLMSHKADKKLENFRRTLGEVARHLGVDVKNRIPRNELESGETAGAEFLPDLGSRRQEVEDFRFCQEVHFTREGLPIQLQFVLRRKFVKHSRRSNEQPVFTHYMDLVWNPPDIRLFELKVSTRRDDEANIQTGDQTFQARFSAWGSNPRPALAFLNEETRGLLLELAGEGDASLELELMGTGLRLRTTVWPEAPEPMMKFVDVGCRLFQRYHEVAQVTQGREPRF